MNQPSEQRRILFVCTANICRSPTAEALARQRFGERDVLFRSAGFLDDGRACPAFLLQSLAERGIDASQHRSYQLDAGSLNAADLVLTMEGDHVQQATLLDRSAFPRIMPLKEAAAELNTFADPVPVETFVEYMNDRRDPSSYLSTRWDVDDPFRKKLKDYRRAVQEIGSLVELVISRLA